jgi:hypothetical protein
MKHISILKKWSPKESYFFLFGTKKKAQAAIKEALKKLDFLVNQRCMEDANQYGYYS